MNKLEDYLSKIVIASSLVIGTCYTVNSLASDGDLNERVVEINFENSEVITPRKVKNPYGEDIIRNAETLLGLPYAFDSDRITTINCLDVVFVGYSKTFKESRWNYKVDPRDMIRDPHLGNTVEGLSPILREELTDDKRSLFEQGDLIYFLIEGYDQMLSENVGPRTLVTYIDEKSYGGWHTALSNGDFNILHAAPGSVVKHDYLFDVGFDALWVSRRTER
jgi:hypothetical protein